MRRRIIVGALIIVDICISCFALFLALILRFEEASSMVFINLLLPHLSIIVFIRIVVFYAYGLYHRLWRYASINELVAIIESVTVSSILIIMYLSIAGAGISISVHIITWLATIILIGLSRLCARMLSYFRQLKEKNCTNVLIIGAGDGGVTIAREIRQRYFGIKKIVGFIDDDPYKQEKMIFGVKILGGRSEIKKIVSNYNVDEIIIAMPSVSGCVMRDVLAECHKTQCVVKTLPGIYELIDGKVTVQHLREVKLEDLLRREPVSINTNEISGYLTKKRVLVTGAGGSIGAELCRQIAKMSPLMLMLLGKGENSIYEIDRELREKYPQLSLKPIIADIRDNDRMQHVFEEFKPEVVFHAAAHKHVPLMEIQPVEAVRNNIFGTKIVAEAADRVGTEIFVMISTDKAVNPTSVMGATKRIAELIIQNMNKNSTTKFVAVRFGNVLGSRGSVVPLFKKQIARGGPITITHPEMKRYFMTIPEAAQLVLQAGTMAVGGEVFVLDMGEPVKVADMAKDLIRLSGLVPQVDIKFKFTGIRPGEKLYEELLTAEEGTHATRHEKIYVANIKETDEKLLHQGLAALQQAVHNEDIIAIMKKLIPTYSSECFAKRAVQTEVNNQADIKPDEHSQSYPSSAQLMISKQMS